MIPVRRPNSQACFAHPIFVFRSITALVVIRVLRRVFMALRTVRTLLPERDTALDIFDIRDQLHVVRINAAAHTAKMIYLKIFWDWSPESFIRDPMSADIAALGPCPSEDFRVSIASLAHPDPTPRFGDHLDVLHQAFNNRARTRTFRQASIIAELCNSEAA